MNLNKAFNRSIPYIKRFYGLASIPIQFIAYTSIIYNQIIIKVVWLSIYFNSYSVFLYYSFLFVFVFIYLGYLYTKKTKFVIEEIEIGVEINPYMNIKIPKVQIPTYRGLIKLFEKNGIDVKDMKRILENSL